MASRVTRAIAHLPILVVVYLLTFLTSLPDYDLWARLAVGSIFFQTGTVLKHDIFSYLPTKSPWIDHEWGSGVVCYAFARSFGEYGIFLLKALLLYFLFLTILKTINAREGKRSVGILYWFLLGYALFPGVASLVRSQMFTYLFFAVWLYGLECVRRQRKRVLWIFPCTMLFWVNLHGGFVAGIGIVALYTIGELLNRKSPLPYLRIALLILPTTLLNPYGPALWRYVVEASLMPRPFIPEWHPISLSGPIQVIGGLRLHFLTGYMLFVGMTLAVAIRSIVQKAKPDWTRIIPIAALFLLSVRHQRHIVFFVIAVSMLLYDQFVGLLDPLRRMLGKISFGNPLRIRTAIRWGLGYVLPVAILACFVPRLSHRMTVDYRRFPVGSLEFIKQNGISGNLATAFDWGSYAMWKLFPQCKVLIDGRYEEVYPDDVFDVAIRFSERQGRWWEVLKRFHTDVVVLPKVVYRIADLSLLPDWKPAYEDFVSVVLLPRDRRPMSFKRPDYEDRAYGREDWSKQINPAQPPGSR
jgi:hypothetical protein